MSANSYAGTGSALSALAGAMAVGYNPSQMNLTSRFKNEDHVSAWIRERDLLRRDTEGWRTGEIFRSRKDLDTRDQPWDYTLAPGDKYIGSKQTHGELASSPIIEMVREIPKEQTQIMIAAEEREVNESSVVKYVKDFVYYGSPRNLGEYISRGYFVEESFKNVIKDIEGALAVQEHEAQGHEARDVRYFGYGAKPLGSRFGLIDYLGLGKDFSNRVEAMVNRGEAKDYDSAVRHILLHELGHHYGELGHHYGLHTEEEVEAFIAELFEGRAKNEPKGFLLGNYGRINPRETGRLKEIGRIARSRLEWLANAPRGGRERIEGLDAVIDGLIAEALEEGLTSAAEVREYVVEKLNEMYGTDPGNREYKSAKDRNDREEYEEGEEEREDYAEREEANEQTEDEPSDAPEGEQDGSDGGE